MTKWPTPRLLLEVKEKGVWTPAKIFVQYKTVQDLLNKLSRLARPYGGVNKVRVKNLHTREEIATTKLVIYNKASKRRKRKRHNDKET